MRIRDLLGLPQPRRKRSQARAVARPPSSQQTEQRPGPPAIALARARYAGRLDIVIDPLETEYRMAALGLEVRAWVSVPQSSVPAARYAIIAEAFMKLGSLQPIDRRIFFLGASYEMPIRDIATLLRMPDCRVRRAMLRAIAALDDNRRA